MDAVNAAVVAGNLPLLKGSTHTHLSLPHFLSPRRKVLSDPLLCTILSIAFGRNGEHCGLGSFEGLQGPEPAPPRRGGILRHGAAGRLQVPGRGEGLRRQLHLYGR